MKRGKLKVLMSVLLTAAMISTTACGASSGSESSGAAEGTDAGSAAESDGTVSAENDADGNGRADKVVYASTQEYTSLIPFLNAKTFTTAVYESLGAYQSYGTDFGGLLMESWEHPDERTYVVKLYEGIHDSAGNDITSEDVVFSYEMVKQSGEISKTSVIESVTAVDDYTIEFVWADTPVVGSFESIMSVVNIIDKDAYEASGDGMASNPIGTGPYVVESWTSGVSMTLKVNENYWASGDQIKFPRQSQNADEIEIQTISETSQLAMALQTGEIDMTENIAATDAPNFEEGGVYSADYTVVSQEAYAPKTILVNIDDSAKTSDDNLRLAIRYALNMDEVATKVNGGANHVTYGVGSPYNPDYDTEAFQSYIPETNIEKAKEYLAASGYPEGTTISLLLIDGGIANDVGTMIQNQLAQIGIEVEVKAEIFPNWLTKKGDPTEWDLILSELSSSDYVTTIWQNAFDNRDGSTEIFSDDPTLQELLEGCTTEENHTQENVNAFQQYISENVYAIPVLATLNYNVYNNSLIEEIAYSGEGTVIPQAFTFK